MSDEGVPNFEGRRLEAAKEIYREIHFRDAYKLRDLRTRFTPRVIWDIGGNLGIFGMLASELWPDAEIHAWEPHPKLHGFYQKNVPHATLHKAAAWTHTTKMGLVSSIASSMKNCGASCLDLFFGEMAVPLDARTITVDCEVPWETAPAPDLIKLDCEGAEFRLVEAMPVRPQIILAECHGARGPKGAFHMNRTCADYLWEVTEQHKVQCTVRGELLPA